MIYKKLSQLIILFVLVLLFPAVATKAAVLQSQTKGFQAGNNSLQLTAPGDNLFYGVIGTSNTGSFILLQNPIGVDKFRINYAGNITAAGAITSGGQAVCLQNGSGCPAATTPNLQTVTNVGNTTTNVINANAGISVDGQIVIDDGAGWHRSYGATGWYNGTYGGGWYMQDATWIRSYGSKSVYSDQGIRAEGGLAGGSYNPDPTKLVTTPTLYSEQAQIGNATGGLKGAGTLNSVQLCIQGDCRTAWPAAGATPTLQVVTTAGNTTTQPITVATINTGIGATEVYMMNQNLRTTDSPTFADVIFTGQVAMTGSSFLAANATAFYLDANGDAQIRVDANNNGANQFKINNGANSTVLTVDESGNLAATGNITAAGQNVCRADGTNCPASGSVWTTSGNNIYNSNIGNVGVGVAAPTAKLQVNPGTGVEGLRVISSDYSPLVIRNTADASDLLRLNQTGNLTVLGTINTRSIGTGLQNIAVNAGAGMTNTGLDANYLQGHSWNDVANLVADSSMPSPEKHYFISTGTATATGGYSALDNKCTNDANAIPGRNYHVYASGTTNRGFVNGVLYSNKKYGTFALTRAEDPDLCRVLGITCDTKWKVQGPYWPGSINTWDTSVASCDSWTTTSGTGPFWYDMFYTSNDVGTLAGTGGTVNCGWGGHLLCIENSASYSDPGAVCGDGAVQTGEYCDDRNTADDATCPGNCQADGGYCGDGYINSIEACDPNNVLYAGRNRCNGYCNWAPDLDADSYTGQTDCWNNDANAFPGSTYQGTASKDYNCDGQISTRGECTHVSSGYAVAYGPEAYCPSDTNNYSKAKAWCDVHIHNTSEPVWLPGYCNGTPYNEITCNWCDASVNYYW